MLLITWDFMFFTCFSDDSNGVVNGWVMGHAIKHRDHFMRPFKHVDNSIINQSINKEYLTVRLKPQRRYVPGEKRPIAGGVPLTASLARLRQPLVGPN